VFDQIEERMVAQARFTSPLDITNSAIMYRGVRLHAVR
jgi:hypothetical protein